MRDKVYIAASEILDYTGKDGWDSSGLQLRLESLAAALVDSSQQDPLVEQLAVAKTQLMWLTTFIRKLREDPLALTTGFTDNKDVFVAGKECVLDFVLDEVDRLNTFSDAIVTRVASVGIKLGPEDLEEAQGIVSGFSGVARLMDVFYEEGAAPAGWKSGDRILMIRIEAADGEPQEDEN